MYKVNNPEILTDGRLTLVIFHATPDRPEFVWYWMHEGACIQHIRCVPLPKHWRGDLSDKLHKIVEYDYPECLYADVEAYE